jgi:hypothetical protein
MDPMILAALGGFIAATVTAIFGRVSWRQRKRPPANAFSSSFHAGWGLGRLMYEWTTTAKSDVTSSFLETVSRVQPDFDALGLDVNLLQSFRKGKLSNDLIPFIAQMETKISAEFGNEAGYAFELGQALVLNTRDIYRYATDKSHRTMVERQDIGLNGITAAIDGPLSRLQLGEGVEREWADIVSSIKTSRFDKHELWPAIQAWIKRVHDSMARETTDETVQGARRIPSEGPDVFSPL